MGYFYAVLSSVFFSLYIVPKKLIKVDNDRFAVILGVCYFILSSIMFLVTYFVFDIRENILNPILWLSFLGAIFWKIGLDISLWAIDKIGIGQTGVYKDLQGPIGCLLILFILQEFPLTKAFLVVGIIIIYFIGAILFTFKDGGKYTGSKGVILMVILCAIFSALSAFIRKYVTLHGFVYSQQVYASVAVMLTAFINYFGKRKKARDIFAGAKQTLYCIVGGIFYFLSTTFMILSYDHIAGSVAFSIISLHAVFTALYGVFIFKEVSFRANWLRIVSGFLCILAGTILLIFV